MRTALTPGYKSSLLTVIRIYRRSYKIIRNSWQSEERKASGSKNTDDLSSKDHINRIIPEAYPQLVKEKNTTLIVDE